MATPSGPPIIPIRGFALELLGSPFDFQIFQTPDYVAILHEEINNLRIIPLDGRPHLAGGISQWLGDSRGRWDGDTLVVETTNFRAQRPYASAFTTEHLRLIERFTRTNTDTIDYQFSVLDPTTWTKPWTATVLIERSAGMIYEFACHEGNYGLPNILSGARAQEALAGEAVQPGSR
jgi:hypothetical protein